MPKSCFTIVVLLIFALPFPLFAVDLGGMGGMGSMGAMVDIVEIETKDVGKVVFSHSKHGSQCGACHPGLFQKKVNSNHVSMKAMERGKSCGGCHNGRKTFTVAANCITCHAGEIAYKETGAGDVAFSHEAHTGMFGCDSCHPDLFQAKRGVNMASMEEMESGQSCGACHDGSTAFGVAEDCESCHQM